MLTASSTEILKRDFNNAIYLEKRSKTNKENIEKLTSAYITLGQLIEDKFSTVRHIDTTYMTSRDTSILMASESIKAYQKKLEKRN